MEDIAKIFHIEWKILLAQSINFSLVVFILWRYAFGPISKILKERSEKINKGLEMAQEAQKNLALTEEKTKEIIREAKMESQKIIKESFENAEKVRTAEIEKAKIESEKIIESGKKVLLTEKENILNSIKKESADLVVSAIEKTLKNKYG